MKKEQKKTIQKRAQTAIEYMLLLTICALIVFVSFRMFFEPGGRVRNGFDLYFNKVSNELMGDAPNLEILPPPPPPPTGCAAATSGAACLQMQNCWAWYENACTGSGGTCIQGSFVKCDEGQMTGSYTECNAQVRKCYNYFDCQEACKYSDPPRCCDFPASFQ